MRKIFLALITVLSFTVVTQAQSKEKIKGSREVVKNLTTIQPFNRIVVSNEIELRLLRSDEPGVEITADDNLHEVIETKNEGGTLTINTNKHITSYKRLNITVFYDDALTSIDVKDEGEIHSDVTLKFNELTLTTQQEGKAFLTVKADKFKLINNNDGESTLNVTADNITLELNDNSEIEALLNGNDIEIDMVQRAEAKLEGNTKNLDINIDNSCEFDGTRLTTKTATVKTYNRCKVLVEVKEELTLEAEGTSEVTIFGEPKINLNKFADEAILYKKK